MGRLLACKLCRPYIGSTMSFLISSQKKERKGETSMIADKASVIEGLPGMEQLIL